MFSASPAPRGLERLQVGLQSVTEAYHDHGLLEATRLLWSGLRLAGTVRLFLFALSQPRPLPEAKEAARGHRFAFATERQLQQLCEQPGSGIEGMDVARVARGTARCLTQWDGERLVGYAWVWNSPIAFIEEGVHLNLPDDAIYNYKSYTAPEYRGFAFQALRHQVLLDRLAPEGKRRLFGFVHHLNSNSLRGVRKSGYQKVGELRITKRGERVHVSLVTDRDFWSDAAREVMPLPEFPRVYLTT